jgi:hypothetical protein
MAANPKWRYSAKTKSISIEIAMLETLEPAENNLCQVQWTFGRDKLNLIIRKRARSGGSYI